jgi:hypothetical protein
MAAKEKEYQRLWGQGVRWQGIYQAGRSRLWLGKDHLLCTQTLWYTQEYKRFYFRDIQAIIIRKTETGKIINLVITTFTVLPLIGAIASSGDTSIFWWSVAGFFGLILLINTIYGATCATHIRTAVQTEELPSVQRIRRANKLLARVRPLIAEAQGELNAAEIPARMEELARPASATTPAATNVPPVIASVAETLPQPPTDAPLAG